MHTAALCDRSLPFPRAIEGRRQQASQIGLVGALPRPPRFSLGSRMISSARLSLDS